MRTSGKWKEKETGSDRKVYCVSDLMVTFDVTCLLLFFFFFFFLVVSLGARIIWRLDKEGSVVSDMQLTTLEELESHIADMQEDELKEFKVDIHNFLDYWPRTSKQHTIDDISHIFGVVRLCVLY